MSIPKLFFPKVLVFTRDKFAFQKWATSYFFNICEKEKILMR